MMLTRLHVGTFIGLTVAAWVLVLWLYGTPVLSADFVRPFGLVVAFLSAVVAAFHRYAWAWAIFRGWYVKRPNLRGTWKVEIVSDYVDPKTGQSIAPITAYMAVRQTLTTLHMRLMTKESKSQLIAHSITLEEDQIYRVAGVYRNEPKIELQGDRSEIHYGSLLLEVHGEPPQFLEGHYWTDRKTRGSIRLTDRKKKLFESFEAVAATFASPWS